MPPTTRTAPASHDTVVAHALPRTRAPEPTDGIGANKHPVRSGRFQRAVGLVILGLAIAAAGLLWYAVAALGSSSSSEQNEGLLFGIWDVLYDTEAPSTPALLAAAVRWQCCSPRASHCWSGE